MYSSVFVLLSSQMRGRLLLFGASGAIGSEITRFFQNENWEVIGVTRKKEAAVGFISWDPLSDSDVEMQAVLDQGPYDAVCWAQGMNCSDSCYEFDLETHNEMYKSNVLFIIRSLNKLLLLGAFEKRARLCVISSIWQESARQNKLSYSVTKSALRGLVLSAANDLAKNGYLVNAVLPGVLDTPMTHQNLSKDQLCKVAEATQFKRLATLSDVAAAVYSVCSFQNTGVTGQFITVDLGYTNVKII